MMGCHPRGKNSVHFSGYGEMSGRYVSDCKWRAKRKKLKFNLNAKYLWELYLKQGRCCALSKVPIEFVFRNTRAKVSDGSASLDRINSTKGYVKGNVQWAHKTINFMKNSLSVKEFTEWCNKVVENQYGIIV